MEIGKSETLSDGVCVWFNKGNQKNYYYAHCIRKIGESTDPDASDSMWGWINHMRHKIWWNLSLERDFKVEVAKHIKI